MAIAHRRADLGYYDGLDGLERVHDEERIHGCVEARGQQGSADDSIAELPGAS